LSLFNWGLPRTRILFGPLLLLAFVIPLPGLAVIALAFRLKVASIQAALFLVRLLGIEAWPSGFQIVLPSAPPGEPLAIGDPCAGLRSLLSFGAVGGVFAFLFPFTFSRRLAAVLAAFVFAPVSNTLRVALLIVLRQTAGPAILRGGIHIALGVGVYIVCLLCYLLVIRWLIRSPEPPPSA
jgi:exosortase